MKMEMDQKVADYSLGSYINPRIILLHYKNRMGRLSAACSLILKYVERRAMWRRFPAACSFKNFQKNHGFEHGFEQLSEAIE